MIALQHGDCLEIMPLIPNKSIDLILCDLPYGTTACKWDVIIPFDKLWAQYERLIKDNGAIVLTAIQPFASILINYKIDLFRYEIIWQKQNITNFWFVKKQIGKIHENILVFYKKQPTYNPQMQIGKPYNKLKHLRKEGIMNDKITIKNEIINKGERYPISVLKFTNCASKGNLHPTQKPNELMEFIVKTFTNEGDTVLDNCMGSGTTGVACKMTNRNFIGIEKELKYFNIANNRINGMLL